MTYTEAAERILAQAGHPLHFREITRLAIAQGLIEVEGLTPWNSMNGTLRRAIRTQGDTIPVVSLGEGCFALRAWGLPAEEIGPADGAVPMMAFAQGSVALDEDWNHADEYGSKGLKWWAFLRRITDLLSRRSTVLPVNAPLESTLRALVAWGGASLVSGAALLLGRNSPLTRGLARQLLTGGATHAAAALWALDSVVQQDAAVATGRAPVTSLAARRPWYRQAYSLAAGVAAITVLSGLAASHSHENNATRGAGVGRVLQGSYLLILAGIGIWRHKQE